MTSSKPDPRPAGDDPSGDACGCGHDPRAVASHVLTAVGVGCWTYDLLRDRVRWDRCTREALGLPEGREEGRLATFLEALHATDRDRLAACLGGATGTAASGPQVLRVGLRGGASSAVEMRLVREDRNDAARWSCLCWRVAESPTSAPGTDRGDDPAAHRVLFETVQVLARTIERRDPYTSGHQQRVAQISVGIASILGLPQDQVTGLRLGAMVHDIGKIFVPVEILNRPGNLTPAEFDLIRTHAQFGHDILKDIRFPWPVARMVLEHHERMDGTGYPNGLIGDAICREARILAVADVVDAISSDRPHRRGLGLEAALDEIRDRAGAAYDAEAVDACLELLGTPVGPLVV